MSLYAQQSAEYARFKRLQGERQFTPADRAHIAGLTDHPDFQRNFQFGIIDNGMLVLFTLLGFSLEDKIAAKVGVPGYGAIMGATVGNALSDGIAGLPQGKEAAAAVTLGALAPVIPFAIAMGAKKKISGTTQKVLLGSSTLLLIYAFASGKMRRADTAGKTVAPPTEDFGAKNPLKGWRRRKTLLRGTGRKGAKTGMAYHRDTRKNTMSIVAIPGSAQARVWITSKAQTEFEDPHYGTYTAPVSRHHRDFDNVWDAAKYANRTG